MKPQINALTSTRAVAAILVVIHHFGYQVYPFCLGASFFHSGNVAVSYFFVLSGFVLYISYCSRQILYADYLKRRLGRIVPVYLFALLLFVCTAYWFFGFSFSGRSVREIVISALLLQAYIPGYPLSLNGPAWSISVELFFYFLFPLFLFFEKRKIRLFTLVTAALYIISQAIHLWYFPLRWQLSDNILDPIFFNPAIHINQFLIGMAGGYLYYKIKRPNTAYTFMSLALFAIIVVLIVFKPQNISYQVGLIAPVFMLFILSVALSNPRFLNFKPLVFLGEISYGIYILQLPVYNFLTAINTKYTHISQLCFFYLALMILIAVSAASYLFFEKPVREKINGLNLRRRTLAIEPNE